MGGAFDEKQEQVSSLSWLVNIAGIPAQTHDSLWVTYLCKGVSRISLSRIRRKPELSGLQHVRHTHTHTQVRLKKLECCEKVTFFPAISSKK